MRRQAMLAQAEAYKVAAALTLLAASGGGLAEGGGLFPAVPGVAQPSAVAAARALGVPSGGLHLGQVIYAEPRLTPPSFPQP